MKRKSVIFLLLFVFLCVMAGVPVPQPQDDKGRAALKRDTTTMDSLALAIYKHNKAVDDSLALDSINRAKKHGIDSPVEFSANDSLVYDAVSGMARLFGDSHVKYQNMDLKSEYIFMSMDSSLVHATGARDTTTGEKFGTPVFQMGSDTYESDTMAFNFKTKKGLIQQVYTQQDEGYLLAQLILLYAMCHFRLPFPMVSFLSQRVIAVVSSCRPMAMRQNGDFICVTVDITLH